MADRVLGVNGSSDAAFLAIVDSGKVLDVSPYTLELPAGLPADRQLIALREEAGQLFRSNDIGRIVLLSAESNYDAKYVAMIPRLTIEVMIAFAAAESGVAFERLSRPRLRSLLDLPQRGNLSELAKSVTPAIGKHWAKKRDLAALAALTSFRS